MKIGELLTFSGSIKTAKIRTKTVRIGSYWAFLEGSGIGYWLQIRFYC